MYGLKNIVVLLVGLFCMFSLKTAAQKKKVKKQIQQLIKEYEAVGLSVAVVKQNKIVYTKAFGWKDLEAHKKLKEKDIFRIASISKSFTATAIMQLVEAGKFSLEDDISRLVGFTVRNPQYPGKVITLKMILSHTSSLNDSQGYFTLDVINPERNTNTAACYSNNEPGSTYAYCNLNFNIAGTIVERFGGERFDQYIVHHILKPLKLYGGYCIDSLNSDLFAQLYEYDTARQKLTLAENAYNPRREEISKYVPGYSAPVFSPTGGMKISARDLALYMIMHMNGGQSGSIRVIQASGSKQMQTPVLETSRYGLALHVTESYIKGKTLVGHTGSAYGLYSNMFFSPAEKFGLVLITNGCKAADTDGWNAFLYKVAQVLYSGIIERK